MPQHYCKSSDDFDEGYVYKGDGKAEIKEEKIKNQLKEIISEIDSYAEKDKELGDPVEIKVNDRNVDEFSVMSNSSYSNETKEVIS